MKILISKIHRFVLAASLSAGIGFGFVSPASATLVIVNPDGKLTHLDTPGELSIATDINDSGQVVGELIQPWPNPSHPFITGPNGVGMTDLGTLGGYESRATGINNAGQVVGNVLPSGGFITGPSGVGITSLSTPVDNISTAYGINSSGQVVGWSSIIGGCCPNLFITGPNGVERVDLDIQTSYDNNYIDALSINDAGQVAGYGGSFWFHDGFITGPNGTGITFLETLNARVDSIPVGINDSGQVTGFSNLQEYLQMDFNNDFIHAFITGPDGIGITDLGTLGGNSSYATAINNSGQVVGYSEMGDGSYHHAFITGPDGVGMTDLNSFADVPVGHYLSSAEGINNLGQVVAVLAVPEPASYALMLAGLGLVGFMARRKESTKQDDGRPIFRAPQG